MFDESAPTNFDYLVKGIDNTSDSCVQYQIYLYYDLLLSNSSQVQLAVVEFFNLSSKACQITLNF